jgi:hypothetical protein
MPRIRVENKMPYVVPTNPARRIRGSPGGSASASGRMGPRGSAVAGPPFRSAAHAPRHPERGRCRPRSSRGTAQTRRVRPSDRPPRPQPTTACGFDNDHLFAHGNQLVRLLGREGRHLAGMQPRRFPECSGIDSVAVDEIARALDRPERDRVAQAYRGEPRGCQGVHVLGRPASERRQELDIRTAEHSDTAIEGDHAQPVPASEG